MLGLVSLLSLSIEMSNASLLLLCALYKAYLANLRKQARQRYKKCDNSLMVRAVVNWTKSEEVALQAECAQQLPP
jgi:hypothetical protein